MVRLKNVSESRKLKDIICLSMKDAKQATEQMTALVSTLTNLASHPLTLCAAFAIRGVECGFATKNKAFTCF